jgi:hypothetical protein
VQLPDTRGRTDRELEVIDAEPLGAAIPTSTTETEEKQQPGEDHAHAA